MTPKSTSPVLVPKTPAAPAEAARSRPAEPRPQPPRERFDVKLLPRGRLLPVLAARGRAELRDEEEVVVALEGPAPDAAELELRFYAPAEMSAGYADMRCAFPVRVAGWRDEPGLGRALVLRWARPLPELIAETAARRFKLLGLALGVVLLYTAWDRWSALRYFWYEPVLQAYSLCLGTYFFSRFFLTFFHKAPEDKGYEPTVTVVISVRNEEAAIAGAIASCFAAAYPDDKREVIVVDDGSTDGTAAAIAEAKRAFPELKAYHLPPSGKRHAMAKGILEAKGEIVIMVDSDTSLDKNALRQIVCGFEDPRLGAVSGYTAAANAGKNWLTRMQDLRYLVSYELMKAPEALYGCVSCCPGCLSAYRREYLLKILDEWLNQTFLGAKATFGDDRSLTNYILKDYEVQYNPRARSTTLVPETWMRYLRQQCRWKKSWVREAPIAGRILARKHPVAAISFYASAVCSLLSPFMALYYVSGRHGGMLLSYAEGMAFLGLLMALFALWRRPTRHWYMAWFWIVTQVLLMGPQTYYAIATMRKNHWGTR